MALLAPYCKQETKTKTRHLGTRQVELKPGLSEPIIQSVLIKLNASSLVVAVILSMYKILL